MHPDVTYVIAGRSLGDRSGIEKLPNVVLIGYAKDAEARALMKYCKAFVFPSTYEGFGIPPMEGILRYYMRYTESRLCILTVMMRMLIWMNCLITVMLKKKRKQQLRCFTHIHGRSQQQVWHSLWTGMRLVYRVIIKYGIRGRL